MSVPCLWSQRITNSYPVRLRLESIAPCKTKIRRLHFNMDRAIAFLSSERGSAGVLYCACFSGLGLCLSALGPVLLDLAVQTSSTLQHTGYCFGIRSFGYMLGSAGGFLYDKFPGHIILGLSMILAAIGTLIIPLVTSVYALGFAVLLQGACM